MQRKPQRGGVWSATPTPLTVRHDLDRSSVERLVEHHVELGVAGIMLAGTCGEGPWLRRTDRELLARTAVAANRGRLQLAFQVTDNSVGRTIDNAEEAAGWGIGVAVVAPPYFLLNANSARLVAFYREIARESPLPIGLYDRGAHSPFSVPRAALAEVLAEPNIVMVKDSSSDAERRAEWLRIQAWRPDLVLLNGDEFDCATYLGAGYDGLLLGGGIFNARLAHRIVAAIRQGDLEKARALQVRMTTLMRLVYGPTIEWWLGGLKELLVQLGVFSTTANLLGYTVPDECRAGITAAINGSDGLGFSAELKRNETSTVRVIGSMA
jgi:dihydrodipicolinate synthase/N-acetylneuraminate lyase